MKTIRRGLRQIREYVPRKYDPLHPAGPYSTTSLLGLAAWARAASFHAPTDPASRTPAPTNIQR